MTEQEKPYTVIVGVSATSKSPTALAWGKALADSHNGRLVAVRIYQVPHSPQGPPGTSSRTAPDVEMLHRREMAQLEADVEDVLGKDHGAELRVIHSSKRRGLINESHDADVLVIDAPRTPSMSPLLAQRVIYAASCPVVVMPPSISGVPESPLHRSARAVGRAALRSAGTSGRPGYRPPLPPPD